jgi:FkbM family methyltransferase
MNSKGFKYLIRSKSFRFMKNLSDNSHHISSLIWNNKKVHYRTSTSDMTLIYEILLQSKYKSEYFFPEEIVPKVIFDIGGNIGITAIYLSKIFPDAVIYSFEPVKENFEMLEKNIQFYQNIKAFNFGLGSKNGNFKVYLSNDSENFGGTSFYPNKDGNKIESYVKCEVKNINDITKKFNIESIDLIKIDTEGAEYDILTSLEEEILKSTSWITGELHGYRDFELLNYLESLGFSIALNKEIDNRLFMFNAGKTDVISKLSRKDIKIL